MPSAYDKYDYPSYWKGRKYEHASEILAINAFIARIPKLKNIIEIGAGYGRIVPTYVFRAKKIVLTDPSMSLLKLARKNFKSFQNIKYIQGTIESLNKRVRKNSYDLVIMVRVLHHIKNTQFTFKSIYKMLDDKGYFILEFPNKVHFKASLKQFLRGNFTFPLDIFPKDLTRRRKKVLPFKNYHPDEIISQLEMYFEILEKRSVSNIRSPFIKRHLPLETCIFIESVLQKPLSRINFGPSIIVLARKKAKPLN
jgi:ubiquinone/menaquinone biosynthesis C-methylase UbiE